MGPGHDPIGKIMKSLQDSGEREEFSTGGVRQPTTGEGRFDLLLAGVPDSIFRLARHFENGAKKYEDHNWRKGLPVMRYIDSANRHITKYLRGDTDEDHLAASIWNLMCHDQTLVLIERGELPKELDNRPEWMKDGSR